MAAVSALEKPGSVKAEPHQLGGELTFFRTLKAADEPEATKPQPSEKLRKAEERAEGDVGGGGSVVVQVSAFQDIGKAHEMVDDLKNRGLTAFAKSSKGDGFYRVYVGPFASKEEASGALKDLVEKGFEKGFVTDLGTR